MPCDSEAQLEKTMQHSPCSLGMITLGETSHHIKKSHHPETAMLEWLQVGTLVDRQLRFHMAAPRVFIGTEEQRQVKLPFPSPNL